MIVNKQRFRPAPLVLWGLSAALLVWGTASAVLAQDKSAPAKPDAKAQKATKAEQNPSGAKPGATQSKKITQRPRIVSPKGKQQRGLRPKARGAAPKPTVVLKPGEVPSIKFDTPTYRFGRVRAGDPIKHDFWFTNTGNGPLEILRVKPS